MNNNIIAPKWIEKYGINEGGRDFLGYEYSGALMLEKLMPGISNITYRIRYYSFFCWVIDQFFKDESISKTEKNFNAFLKNRSLIFLLANGMISAEKSGTNIDGIDTARSILLKNAGSDQIVITDDDYASYRNNYWVYRQKMSQLGLTAYNDENVESLTVEKGKKLAEYFDQAISGTSYHRNHLGQANFKLPISISRAVLLELGEKANFLDLESHKDEQEVLKKIFLDNDLNNLKNNDYQNIYVENKNIGTAQARYNSLKFYLKIINDTNLKLNEKIIREIQYFSPICPVYSFNPGESLRDTSNTWEVFQARQYFIYSIESIFRSITAISLKNSLSLDQLVESLINNVEEMTIKDFFGLELNFDDKIENILIKILDNTGKDFAKSVTFDSKVNEEKIYEKIRQHNTEINYTYSFGFSVIELLYLFLRFRDSKKNNYWEFAKTIDRDGYLSLDVFINEISSNLEVSFKVFLSDFIKKYIINRHIQIALEKFSAYRNDTFHLSYEEGKILSTKHAISVLNASKFQNIINTLNDLGLIVLEDDKYSTTQAGLAVINE